MEEVRLQFSDLPWEAPAPVVRQKVVIRGKQRLRIVEFTDAFVEEDWCTAGHVGYVLSGTMEVSFDGHMQRFQAGDGLWIEAGEASRHKVTMQPGTSVELLLFETLA